MWMLYHHSDMDDSELEGEPRADVATRQRTYDSRIFLMFVTIVEQKFGRWGRGHQPQFGLKTFKQMRVMAICLGLDEGKVLEVEEMLRMIEQDGDNERILAGLKVWRMSWSNL